MFIFKLQWDRLNNVINNVFPVRPNPVTVIKCSNWFRDLYKMASMFPLPPPPLCIPEYYLSLIMDTAKEAHFSTYFYGFATLANFPCIKFSLLNASKPPSTPRSRKVLLTVNLWAYLTVLHTIHVRCSHLLWWDEKTFKTTAV